MISNHEYSTRKLLLIESIFFSTFHFHSSLLPSFPSFFPFFLSSFPFSLFFFFLLSTSAALIGDNILYFGGGANNSNGVSVLKIGASTYGKYGLNNLLLSFFVQFVIIFLLFIGVYYFKAAAYLYFIQLNCFVHSASWIALLLFFYSSIKFALILSS